MRTGPIHRRLGAFTMIELAVIVAIIALLATLLLPAMVKAKNRAMRIRCISMHKQLSMGLRLFANDAGGYPFRFLSNPTKPVPGLTPLATNNPSELWKLLQVAANDISSPYMLVCPSDPARKQATSFDTNGVPTEFAHPANRLNAISYFLSLDADEESPGNIQMGDRYLTTDPEGPTEKGTKFLFGQQNLGSASPTAGAVRWISMIHSGGGNVALMDGSAQQLTTATLRKALTNQPVVANRIWLPNTDATGRGNP